MRRQTAPLLALLITVHTAAAGLCYDPYSFPGKGSKAAYEKAMNFTRPGFKALQEGKLQEALSAYTKAIAIYPQDANMYNNRGAIFSRLGKSDLALADFRKAVALEPSWGEAYNNLADELMQRKDYSGAENAIKVSARLSPKEPIVWITLAEICIATNRPAEAKRYLLSASKMPPSIEQSEAVKQTIKSDLDKVNMMLGAK